MKPVLGVRTMIIDEIILGDCFMREFRAGSQVPHPMPLIKAWAILFISLRHREHPFDYLS